MVDRRPSGTLTFFFTDVEGSTQLWESAPDDMRRALERHDAILRTAIDQHEGYIFATGGDGYCVAFNRVGDALDAAIASQNALSREPWPEKATIKVRMGIHTGEATERGGDYFGSAVNRAARLTATAHGGQIVCSASSAGLAEPTVPLRDLGEYRLRDLTAAEHIFQVGDETFPSLRSVDAVPTNLPTLRTELIGRAENIKALTKLCTSERLVTLTGVGGVGKTRLALSVGASVASGFADGCWLVDLAPVADGDEVLLATSVAVHAPSTDLPALEAYLADRRMFVILDNCEHVIGDVANMVDAVLGTAAEVHMVVTSREPLGLDGEIVRRVDSLAVPGPDATVEEAGTTSAVRLFVERSASGSDGFNLDATNVGPVSEICRRLDGIPLAIELAAARVRSMPPAEISRRLDERFRLLSGGSRRAQERHRTLQATVAWSHDLLSDDEQRVFRRLAVFPASFNLDAAEVVAAHDDAGVDVVDCVLGLVDRSLVQFQPESGRYRLLETLRQYAADRLGDAGETEAVRERHARHFLGLVERLAEWLLDDRYFSAKATLYPELDNLRSAATWCIDQALWTNLARFCDEATLFTQQFVAVDASDWLRQITEHREEIDDDQKIIDALGQLAYLETNCLGDSNGALRTVERCIALADETGLHHSTWAWVARPNIAIQQGRTNYEDQLADAERALQLADTVGPHTLRVVALIEKGSTYAAQGMLDRAQGAVAEGLRRADETGQPLCIGAAVVVAASNFLSFTRDPDFEASMRVFASRPDALGMGGLSEMWLDTFLGWTLLGLGSPHAVNRLAGALRAADQLNAQHVVEFNLRLLAVAFAQAGHLREAAILVEYADKDLRPYQLVESGRAWVTDRLDDAGVKEVPPEQSVHRRGDIMSLVSTVERELIRRGLAASPDGPGLVLG